VLPVINVKTENLMLGISMPGPIELLILLVEAGVVAGVVWVLIRVRRSPSRGPRGFEVDPRNRDSVG
jgi:hypothetical protein